MRENNIFFKHIDFLILDIFCLQAAFCLGYYCVFKTVNPYTHEEWRRIAVYYQLIDILVLYFGNYTQNILWRGTISELLSIIHQSSLVSLLLAEIMYLEKIGSQFSRMTVVSTGILFITICFILRTLWKFCLRIILKNNKIHQVLVGEGDVLKQYIAWISSKDNYRYVVDAYVADHPLPDIQCFSGPCSCLPKILSEHGIAEVIIAPSEGEQNLIRDIVPICQEYGKKIKIIPNYQGFLSASAKVKQCGLIKQIDLRSIPLESFNNAVIKRTFDIIASFLLIILTIPIMLITAFAVKVSSPGPVLFKQKRVGLNRREYTMLKFRSMRMNDIENSGWTTKNDPRKTVIGSLIRKFSIDELPQLFNVLIGNMSLIGPRPEIPYHVDHFKNEIPLYMVRHQVRPGITGWAQVHGLRGDTDIGERIEYDIWYIEHWSIALDIKIMFLTLFSFMNSETLSMATKKEDAGMCVKGKAH